MTIVINPETPETGSCEVGYFVPDDGKPHRNINQKGDIEMNDIKITNLFGSKTKEFVLKAISLFEATLDRKDGKREFSAICGISARRHIRTDWRESCPDRFYFYKNGRSYWTDIDSLRYDGENANCVYTGRN